MPEEGNWGTFGVLHDGTVLICDQRLRVLRSNDWGKTWSEPVPAESVDDKAYRGGPHTGECTRIVQLRDGTVWMNLYFVQSNSGEEYAYVYRSRDGGKTWGDCSPLLRGGSEVNLLETKSGRILAAVRDQGQYGPSEFITVDPVPSLTTTYRVDFVKKCVSDSLRRRRVLVEPSSDSHEVQRVPGRPGGT